MKELFLILIFLTCGLSLNAQTVMFRSESTVGYFKNDNASGLSYNYGGKIILMANNFQRYGILINHLALTGDNSYLSLGIYLEQVIFRYFNMGIGTVGYIGLQDKQNPFGIYSHLGFEYPFAKRFTFLSAYQGDMIFTRQFTSTNALMMGISVCF